MRITRTSLPDPRRKAASTSDAARPRPRGALIFEDEPTPALAEAVRRAHGLETAPSRVLLGVPFERSTMPPEVEDLFAEKALELARAGLTEIHPAFGLAVDAPVICVGASRLLDAWRRGAEPVSVIAGATGLILGTAGATLGALSGPGGPVRVRPGLGDDLRDMGLAIFEEHRPESAEPSPEPGPLAPALFGEFEPHETGFAESRSLIDELRARLEGRAVEAAAGGASVFIPASAAQAAAAAAADHP